MRTRREERRELKTNQRCFSQDSTHKYIAGDKGADDGEGDADDDDDDEEDDDGWHVFNQIH